jgi:cell division protein FtsI (penicillin-binding protein 3)
VPLPGEASGVLRPRGRAWNDFETATASYGQGITVNTLQLAMAMGAIANGGKLLEPILVKKVTDGAGATVRESSVHVRREAVPPGVAKTVAEMLTAVTEPGGTAADASIPGFRVAGKTSTAQKVDPTTGKYSSDKYTAGFVGFVPVEKPRIVVAVVLDEPTIGHHGGECAVPVFRRVAEASLRYLGVTPSASSAKIAAVRREGDPADATLAMMKPPTQTSPMSPLSPSPGAPTAAVAAVPAVAVSASGGAIRVPDATGLPAHDVVATLTKAGLVPQIEGWGRAVRQSPAPGSAAPKGSAVRVVLEPAS